MQSSLLTKDKDSTHGKLRSPQMPLSGLSRVSWPPARKHLEALAVNHLVYSTAIITASRSELAGKSTQ